MPADLVHMLNLDYLYPPFFTALMDCLMECRLLGVDYKAYSGYRPFDEQKKLYEAYLAGGSRAAPPGLSAHNYGLAIDCAKVLPTGKLSWDKLDYSTLLATVPKHGLVSGNSFGDSPHVQWPGVVTARELLPLKTVYLAESGDALTKLKAVWKVLDEQHSRD